MALSKTPVYLLLGASLSVTKSVLLKETLRAGVPHRLCTFLTESFV